MSWGSKIMGALGLVPKSRALKAIRNAYAAASLNRLFAGAPTVSFHADYDIRASLRILRARSRDLYQNNDYVKKFIKMVGMNVAGPRGVGLQNKAVSDRPTIDPKTGEAIYGLDSLANDRIETGWKLWGKKGTCDVTGKLSWPQIQRLYIEGMAREGEVLVREVFNYDNDFGYALQFIDVDCLDETLNRIEPNGNIIRMGVEHNQWNRPVAYWLLRKHPGDYMGYSASDRWERVPASEIIHDYIVDRVNQSRGVPWMHASINTIDMLGGIEDAEAVATRMAAAQMAVITSQDGEFVGTAKDKDGNPIIDAEPGTFPVLPTGCDIKAFNPQHPNGNFALFAKHQLRRFAAGVLVAYTNLAGDREAVNYSSGRLDELDERDIWQLLQEHELIPFCERVYSSWLKMALLKGAVNLPLSKYDKFNAPAWQPRTWPWVDPLKEQAADVEEFNLGCTTRSRLAQKRGLDYEEDILKVLADEKRLEAKYGIEFPSVSPSATSQRVAKEDSQQPERVTKKQSAVHHQMVMNYYMGGRNDE